MKKLSGYLGIDPGAHGAAVVWCENNQVLVHDFKDLETAVEVLRSWASNLDIKLAALERVQTFPRDGRVGAFNFGANFGQWRAILACFEIPSIEPTPAEWKKSIPPLPIDDKKQKAVEWCKQIFPGAEHFLKRIKDSDRAEALLLAKYARDYDRVYSNRDHQKKAVTA